MPARTPAEKERRFKEIQEEHRRALAAGDVAGLQRVQDKLAELHGRQLEKRP